MRLIFLLVVAELSGTRILCAQPSPADPTAGGRSLRVRHVEPKDAVSTIKVLDGFRVELLAAEPLVTDPVALAYDENGRAWVAEMGDYPYSDKSQDRPYEEDTSLPLGLIRVLEDTDGDGRFDKSTVFVDEISWPTGLTFWKGGVFVTCTPDILYLKDTDGDLKADVRRVVFTGFRKFNVQGVINNLAWGLDHQIYCAGASNGGAIVPGDRPNSAPIRFRRNDFRIDPVTE
jgi:putative membrane-bound dehydrogenase-like protein